MAKVKKEKKDFYSSSDVAKLSLDSEMKRDYLYDTVTSFGLNGTGGAGWYIAKTKKGSSYMGFSFRTAGQINGDVRVFSSKSIMLTWSSLPLNEFQKKLNIKSVNAFYSWAKNKSSQLKKA